MTRPARIRVFRQGASMLFCPAGLPLSHQTFTCTAGVIRRHRKQIGSSWRRLNPGWQVLLVLAGIRPAGRRGVGVGRRTSR